MVIPELKLDLAKSVQEIEELIREKTLEMKRNGAIVPLSGGLDSSTVAVLTVRSLGAERVTLLYMPERDSSSLHKKHAQLLAKSLGCDLLKKSLTMTLWMFGTYGLLPISLIPTRKLRAKVVAYGRRNYIGKDKNYLLKRMRPKPNTTTSKANAYGMSKHRIRMAKIYQYAEVHNLMVVGAANRTEWLTGSFSKWGVDHCADVMPVLHLYRTQLEQVAAYLDVPAVIREKPADPDMIPSVDDKGASLGGFKLADQILVKLENGESVETLVERYEKRVVEDLHTLWNLSKHMRESPYSLL